MKKVINGRVIGIRHRVKQTKEGKASPTIVAIVDGDNTTLLELETEQEELDFLLGVHVLKFRPCNPLEDVSLFAERQVIFRDAEPVDEGVVRHPSQSHYKEKKGKNGEANEMILLEVADKVPSHFTGVKAGDTVSMTLGGSGDYFAFALSVQLGGMGGAVLRIPPFKLKTHRGEGKKDDDAVLLARLAMEHSEDFYETEVRDRGIIKLRCLYQDWMQTMQARIACEQRLFQRNRDQTFCTDEGCYPQGSITKAYEARRANDPILLAHEAEEHKADKALKKAVEALDVWQQVFVNIPGVGHRIAARLIFAVIDIRRFEKASQLVSFMGVHVMKDGSFPRRRAKMKCNWHPDGRQGLYLLGDQFVRQSSKTHWGRYLIARKAALQLAHPEPVMVEVVVDGKSKMVKRYTKGHIHKMGIWRTLTRFTEYMFREWKKVEKSAAMKVDETNKAA